MRSLILIQYRAVKEEWGRFIFKDDSKASSRPLTFGKPLSDEKNTGSGEKAGGFSTLSPTEKVFSTAFNATTVAEIGPVVFSEFEAELELRNTEARPTQFRTREKDFE
jgi:hypothetical protein